MLIDGGRYTTAGAAALCVGENESVGSGLYIISVLAA